jgi:HlyD family secretion protein
MRTFTRRWPFLLGATVALSLLVLAAITARGAGRARENAEPRYLTQAVDVGVVERSITASGTLNPVNQVQVGTQVSGAIKALYADFNSVVTRGQLLAQLDTSTLDAELASAEAALRSARASLELAEARHRRNEQLFARGFAPRADVEESLQGLRSAQATLDQKSSALRNARSSRGYAEVRSPVSGVVVSREVSVGQTVAASFTTPVLFKIAEDLREMQIEVNVSESDIGAIGAGQAATFTVDAFPDRTFAGRVHQVRNNYTVQQNVVTYSVVVRARNEDLALRPGMTGYVSIVVGRRERAVRLPNAALRFKPASADAEPGAPAAAEARGPTRTVWQLVNGRAEAVTVRVGLSDGRWTEQVSGPLAPGDALVIGEPPAAAGRIGPKFF